MRLGLKPEEPTRRSLRLTLTLVKSGWGQWASSINRYKTRKNVIEPALRHINCTNGCFDFRCANTSVRALMKINFSLFQRMIPPPLGLQPALARLRTPLSLLGCGIPSKTFSHFPWQVRSCCESRALDGRIAATSAMTLPLQLSSTRCQTCVFFLTH
jgi:hypothetical protein